MFPNVIIGTKRPIMFVMFGWMPVFVGFGRFADLLVRYEL